MSQPQEMLRDAVSRNVVAVLSLPAAGMVRHVKSRFLAIDPRGFYLESPAAERPMVDALVAERRPCGVSFRHGTTRFLFTATPLARQEQFVLNAPTVVEALLLDYPREMKAVQRRAAYRIHVSPECGLRVRIWTIPAQADLRDRPPAGSEVTATLLDISLGGIAVMLGPKGANPLRLSLQDRLRIEIGDGSDDLLMEGRMCYPDRVVGGGSIRAGIEFCHLETTLAGRHTLTRLTRLTGVLQREEVRRHRLVAARGTA